MVLVTVPVLPLSNSSAPALPWARATPITPDSDSAIDCAALLTGLAPIGRWPPDRLNWTRARVRSSPASVQIVPLGCGWAAALRFFGAATIRSGPAEDVGLAGGVLPDEH